ncbi:hypothetical protein Tco_0897674 [Tanacetum coccineum]
MTTMTKHVNAPRDDNFPPMLDKSQYNSWQSRMLLYIKGKEHGKDFYDSVINEPFQYGTVEVPETETTLPFTRERTYDDLTDKEKIREACDISATNIVFQGLPPDVYSLVNHHIVAKEIWDKVKLLIKAKMEQVFTDVKLARDMHSTNFDQLYAYSRQHEAHANEVRLMRQSTTGPSAILSSTLCSSNTSGLVVPVFLPSNDPIASFNKAMAFISIAFASRYPPTNNQLRTSSNPRNQETIQDDRVTIQNVQGRQTQGEDTEYLCLNFARNHEETKSNTSYPGEFYVVFDGAFGGVGNEEVVVGEGVVVTSSSLEMLTNSCLGGIMVSFIFMEGIEEEALVEFIVEWFEEDQDDKKNGKDTMLPTNNGSTEDVQPPVIQVQSQNPTSEPDVDPVSAPRPNQQTSIPFPSRRNDERRREKANDQIEKFYEIFRDLSFEISFTDALTLMPKFASTLKTLLGNKEKLSEMARTPLNENCSAVILNKLPKKLGDPGRFLIPCEFSGLQYMQTHLADLRTQAINLLPIPV